MNRYKHLRGGKGEGHAPSTPFLHKDISLNQFAIYWTADLDTQKRAPRGPSSKSRSTKMPSPSSRGVGETEKSKSSIPTRHTPLSVREMRARARLKLRERYRSEKQYLLKPVSASLKVVVNTDVQQLAGVPKYSVEMDIEQTIQMDICGSQLDGMGALYEQFETYSRFIERLQVRVFAGNGCNRPVQSISSNNCRAWWKYAARTARAVTRRRMTPKSSLVDGSERKRLGWDILIRRCVPFLF